MGIQHLPILMLLLGVAVLVFGPKRLPELGHGLGKAIIEFRKAGQELTEGVSAPAEVPNSATSSPATLGAVAAPAASAEPVPKS